MTHAEQISMSSVMSGKTDETLLSTYLTVAGRKIIERCYPYSADEVEEVPRRYHVLQCEIATYLIARIGTEGEVTRTENDVTRQYKTADVPNEMMDVITPMVGVIQ